MVSGVSSERLTSRQLVMIDLIEAELGVKFEGLSKSQATEFISKHIEEFNESRAAKAFNLTPKKPKL